METGLPEQFRQRMKQLLGEESENFFASYKNSKVQGLRVNTLKAEPENFFSSGCFSLTSVPWTETGFYYPEDERPGKHPYHEAGVYYIQEPSAMAVGEAVFAAGRTETGLQESREIKQTADEKVLSKRKEKILDLCAAPGGKTSHLACMMEGNGLLWSNEIHPARAKILSQNVERMGITNCVVTNETAERLAERLPEFFDRVLVDAPCSGEGMFRKQAEACQEWSLQHVQMCAKRQSDILSQADKMIKPGGILVYSTCTFAPAENEGTINRFLQEHPEYETADLSGEKRFVQYFSPGRPEWIEDGSQELKKTFRLWPHRLNGEGHYIAVLRKKGISAGREEMTAAFCRKNAGNKKNREDKTVSWLPFAEFLAANLSEGRIGNETILAPKELSEKGIREVLKNRLSGRLVRFGEQLYLAPEGMADIGGLKVLRPGLHLGTVKKERFEPSHGLALALRRQQAVHVYDLSLEKRGQAEAYLRGESFPAEGEKGWYLITIDGYSLGWGKLVGGVMKNHYPKGLRI